MKKLFLFLFVLNTSICQAQEKSKDININLKISGFSKGSKDKEPANESQTNTQPPTKENQNTGKVPQVQDGLMCPSPSVNDQNYMKVKYNVSYVGWDMYKAKDAKKFMETNCMLSVQVAGFVKLITSSDWQLDVAQFGYLHTYDQANYQLVVDALTTPESKTKLLDFIGSNAGGPSGSGNAPLHLQLLLFRR